MFDAWHRKANVELVKFVTVGLLNTVICLSIIYLLKWYLHWSDTVANFVGYFVCIGLGFFLNGRWTFERQGLKANHLMGYLLVIGVAYLMNLLVVLTSLNELGVSGDLAQILGVPVFTLTTYWLNKTYVFSGKD